MAERLDPNRFSQPERPDQQVDAAAEAPEAIAPDHPESVSPLLNEDAIETPGTRYHGFTDRNTGSGKILERNSDRMASGGDVTGGDLDANIEQAKVVGDEAVGGTAPTPEQNVVELLGQAQGIDIPDGKPLQTNDMLNRRDDARWELDPESSEDYEEHGA